MAAHHRPLGRIVRASAVAGVPLTAAAFAGGAAAGAIVAIEALGWVLLRWPRWEERWFGPGTAVARSSQPWVPPHAPRSEATGLGPAGHRAFAQALHAVTAAYLAECERETQR
jgi:hypothetical protein